MPATSLTIKNYPFDQLGRQKLALHNKGKDWPVVYAIHNSSEIYVGETQSAENRFGQHLASGKRKGLDTIEIIFDDEFNKSAILDIEQSLIQFFGADNKYKLQNLNSGQSSKHNYYQREKYLNKVEDIWNGLSSIGLTNKTYEEIKNSNLFKYSPYNSLTTEQKNVSINVINHMLSCLEKGESGTAVINGSAGTGKTIVLINMIFTLINACKVEIDETEEDDELHQDIELNGKIQSFVKKHGEIKIGYVVPMTSIRRTLKTVFRQTKNGLKANMVIGPFNTVNADYDVLFVDESHRLAQRKNIGFMGSFDEACKNSGLNPLTSTQLDILMKNSKYRVLVYDKEQTVKGSDITDDQFEKSILGTEIKREKLTTQMRCAGGGLYVDYIRSLFGCELSKKESMVDYDFKLFDDVDDMVQTIKALDKKCGGLCRNAAGYSWEWISKGHKKEAQSEGLSEFQYVQKHGLEDITIDGHKYIWNMTNDEFILSQNSVNEIGCIHTLQGYDLNYVGVILGEEIDYDPIKNEITIDPNKFYDSYVKQGSDLKTLKNFIINSYRVIMSRGIKGCYVYACNKNLNNYLKQYIEGK